MISTSQIEPIDDVSIASLQDAWVPMDISNMQMTGKLRLTDLFRIYRDASQGLTPVVPMGVALKFTSGDGVKFTSGDGARVAE